MAFVELIDIERCRRDGGTFVERGDRELAVFRLDDGDRVVVLDNACPHASGNLSGGEIVGGVVHCPWHFWEFDIETGVCTHSARARVHRYPAEVRDGVIWIDLPE